MPAAQERSEALVSLAQACKKVLVLGWYTPGDLAELIDDNITEEEYQYIIDNYTPFEDVRESLIRDVEELLQEIRAAKKLKK